MGFLGLNAYELATLGGFMFFWGWVFLASTLWVLTVRNDEFAPQPGSKASQLAAAYKEMVQVLTLGSVRSLAHRDHATARRHWLVGPPAGPRGHCVRCREAATWLAHATRRLR